MATKTLGLTGRDYSTLAAWATYVNALSLAADEILEVYNDGGAVADTAAVTVGGWTANGFSVTLRAAAGQGIAEHANKLTNPLRYDASKGAALTNSVGYTTAYVFIGANLTVEGLQIRATAGTASGTLNGSNGVTVSRCLISKSSGGYIVIQGAGALVVNDSLLIAPGAANGVQALATGLAINNCTIATTGGVGIGIAQPYSVAPVVKNTAVYGFATDFAGTAGSGTTNNATDKGSFGGTGWGVSGQVSIGSADFESVSSGSEDFRVKSGSTKLIDTGASSVGTGLDVVGTTRTGTLDIGAWEFASDGGGGTAPSITTQPSNQSVTAGAAATFTTAASGSPAPTFQWQRNPGGVDTWADIASATAASYTTPATTVSGGSANNGDTYRAVATNASGSATSTAATLTVTAATAQVTQDFAASYSVIGSVQLDLSTTYSIGETALRDFSAAYGVLNLASVDISASYGIQGPATFTSEPLKDNTGLLQASKALNYVALYNTATGSLVVRKTGLSTNSSGVFSVSDALLVAGTIYAVDWETVDGKRRMPRKAAA